MGEGQRAGHRVGSTRKRGGKGRRGRVKEKSALLPLSPVEFVRETLGGEPYLKQEEVLMGVLESRRTSVVGCNGSGKDWAAARSVL